MKQAEDDNKIIKFDPNFRLSVVPKPREGFCQHQYVLVDQQTRMLECETCKQVIDPYDYIWEWANRDRNLSITRNALKKDIKRLREEIENLKREETNTKARLKRLKGIEAR